MAMQKIKNGGFVAEEISKVNANFTEVESNYAKKNEIPTIPTNVSGFTNDAGYITDADVPKKTSELTNDSGYITSSAVPTKVSQLTNDSNFVNQTQLSTAVNGISVPTKTSELTNDSGYITISAVPTTTSELANDSGYITSAAIPRNVSSFANDAGYAKTSELPTKTSQLTNDSNFVNQTTMNSAIGNAAPSKVAFAASDWSNSTYTTPANNKMPVGVMRKNGSNYESVLVDIQTVGTNVVITSDETFEGYLILV